MTILTQNFDWQNTKNHTQNAKNNIFEYANYMARWVDDVYVGTSNM